MKKLNWIVFLLLLSSSSFAKIQKIYDTKLQKYITEPTLINSLPANGIVVLGEFHNDPLIQSAQAKLINKTTRHYNQQGNVSLHWEFLNFTDQTFINTQFQRLKSNEISSKEFVSTTAGANNTVYATIFDQLKNLNGDIIGVNLPRKIKQKVITDGIQSIDPIYVPRHHYNGDDTYRELFTAAMGAHVPSSKIKAYFTAQCLTDSVMADTIVKNTINGLNFFIAGSFHTDFYNGTVLRLLNLTNIDVVTMKIVNTNQVSEQNTRKFISGHRKYGAYADYIVLVK